MFHIYSFGVLTGISCAAILLGICGICCSCKTCVNNIALPIFHGIFLFLIWIVILLIGVLLTTVSFTRPSTIQSFCSGNITNARLNWASDQIKTIDTQVNNYVDSFMCSFACPCATTYSTTWKNVSESVLN